MKNIKYLIVIVIGMIALHSKSQFIAGRNYYKEVARQNLNEANLLFDITNYSKALDKYLKLIPTDGSPTYLKKEQKLLVNNRILDCKQKIDSINYLNNKKREQQKAKEDSLTNIQQIKKRDKFILDSIISIETQKIKLKEKNKKDSVLNIKYRQQFLLDSINDEILKIRKQIVFNKIYKTSSKGICILNWWIEENYSTISVKIKIFNPTIKTIKYINIGVIGYNAVGDKIVEHGKTQKNIKGIGPIYSNNTASYDFEYVWFTDILQSAKITYLKVDYTDGTTKTILDPGSVILNASEYSIFNGTDDGLETNSQENNKNEQIYNEWMKSDKKQTYDEFYEQYFINNIK